MEAPNRRRPSGPSFLPASGTLPSETGGVFIGAFDVERKIVYVVDLVPSPPDSKEWPVLYIRGCRGLVERLEEVHQATGGMLQYVGEWHSHPDGCSTNPSGDDRKVFRWLVEHMQVDGIPPVMAIVGQGENIRWFVESID
jgi:integrative and conjugative element protein (TIGR02256 family)